MNRIVVIDYGMGNLHSVGKALEHVGENISLTITADAQKIREADRLIFPGVGAMRDCMAEIKRLEIDELLKQAREEKPVLGICVGMQAMLSFSEENNGVDCIDLFPGRVKRFQANLSDENGDRLKVPHMGWNEVTQTAAHPMWQGIANNSRFYFVHSFYVVPDTSQENSAKIVGESSYPLPFCSAIAEQNIFAVQFHPEKSQNVGLQLLKNFLSWDGEL
ncbi:MAG: imidazole glycerol phosphate synthase subunit HisH [SAR86 cluster bacterium]|uniref:Imidazole glycerol phosphate synthase subunit HisH n=1 Tax=SAR86 cluster bacterium TaxID=2030880 RepID=A0A2A5CIZ2_9GAMM|nr:MAG: imidazole glycerol phosphate synthase subunit HisH [SAR86 cluster bacterium]